MALAPLSCARCLGALVMFAAAGSLCAFGTWAAASALAGSLYDHWNGNEAMAVMVHDPLPEGCAGGRVRDMEA